MTRNRIQEYLDSYAEHVVRFNPHAIKKMGLQQSQTLLKLEDYMLVCAPYQLSMKRAVLLVILTKDEATFFKKFQKKITSLSFSVQRPGQRESINLFIRGTLDHITPLKGRDNIYLVDVSLKSCPNDLVEIIGDYISSYHALEAQFEKFKGKAVLMNEKSAVLTGFNNYVESQIAEEKVQTRLLSLAVNKIVLGIPKTVQNLAVDQKIISKLYFQSYQFALTGKVSKIEEETDEFRKVECGVEFTPELVEIMDNYFFRLSFKKK